MNPLMGVTLAHPAQSPLHDLEGIGLQGDQDTQPSVLRRGQGTVLLSRVLTGRARSSIEAPVGHVGLERGLKGWDQLPKLVPRETGQIQDLRGAGLQIGKPSTAHGCDLLSLEAQHTINRD
jgi:hypothetical protein